MECVNYKHCDLIGTPKFLPLAQECCRFSPDPSPSQRGGVWARDYWHIYLSIQYRRSLPYLADRSAPNGKSHIDCMHLLYVHRIHLWLIESRKAWAANIANDWLSCRSIQRNNLWIISTLKVKIKMQPDHSSRFIPFYMPI